MKRWIATWSAMCFAAGSALGADLKDAKEILTKADEATKKVQSVRYKGSARGTGAAAERQPAVEGVAILAGKTDQPRGKFRSEVKVTPKDSSEVKEVTAGSDGQTYFVIDPQTKTVYEDMDPGVWGTIGRPATAILMREYWHPEPFSDELKGDKAELKEEKKIGSEECYQIHVVYSSGQGEAIWFFSKKDFLPRGVERIFSREGQSGSLVLELTELEVDPKVPDDAFKATVPEGYKKSDDFAP